VLQCVTSREVSLVNNELTPNFTISKMYCVKTSKILRQNIHSIGTDEVSIDNDELTTAVVTVSMCCSMLQCFAFVCRVLVNTELTTPRFTISKIYCVTTSDNLLENIHSKGTYKLSIVKHEFTSKFTS